MSRPSPRLTLGLCLIAIALAALNFWGWSEISRREHYRDKAQTHSDEIDKIYAEIATLAKSRALAAGAMLNGERQFKRNQSDTESTETFEAVLLEIRSDMDLIDEGGLREIAPAFNRRR